MDGSEILSQHGSGPMRLAILSEPHRHSRWGSESFPIRPVAGDTALPWRTPAITRLELKLIPKYIF
ncbi:hypothetical protein CHELA40_10419 [Chelatococcus asaccharovorans]|nr:hypothetical protein CHELA40_10419 [Chelatococcus asaccharovorans]CAH1686711.1 hypothetical protein CHELA17_65188 [Chelatococcus asaccharovorans]